jgi:hypothetical protein
MTLDRREFLGLGLLGGIAIFAPRFGRWFRPNRVYIPEWIDLPVKVDFGAGVGARPEGDYIPVPPPPMIVSLRIDKHVMEACRPDPGAFDRYVRRELARQVKLKPWRMGLEAMIHDDDFRVFRSLGG